MNFYFVLRGSDSGAILGTNPHRYKVDHFQVFWLMFKFIPCKFAACLMPQSKNNHRKEIHRKTSYPRAQRGDHCEG